MSFAKDVKNEICAYKGLTIRHKEAQACGLIMFGRSFSRENIALHTESRNVAKLYARSIADLTAVRPAVTTIEHNAGKRDVYMVNLDNPADCAAVYERFSSVKPFDFTEKKLYAFLSGVYLACGNVTDPQKSYHVEFILQPHCPANPLLAVLEGLQLNPRLSSRRGGPVVYIKKSEKIEELLTMLGASRFALEVMDVKIYKEMRNRVNRRLNCDTANIEKLVEASGRQVAGIRRIAERQGLESLPDDLRDVAIARLENPEMSLQELCEILPGGMSRSSVNYRLKKLIRLSEELDEWRR